MTNNSIYNSIINAKTGTEIPLFANGRSVDSKYNPERDAENIINSIDSSYSFFIVIGVGSGVLINLLSKKFLNGKIICFEKDKCDYDFLLNLKTIKDLKNNSNIFFSTSATLQNDLINNYLPAIYGDIKIIEQRGWIDENKDFIPSLNKIINKSIGIISSDYSVQCHFGNIWQNNILNNLKLGEKLNTVQLKSPNLNKIAAVIAAGPSLDNSIKILKQNLQNYYIIATDTTYSSLVNNNIIPDIVISIDGQEVSHNHFTNIKDCKNTIFALDLCSNFSISNHLKNLGCNIIFFISGHPLSSLAYSLNNNLPQIFSGAGTVTISALDLAYKLGFKKIEIFGGDFSYRQGKPYTNGTYFETIFGKDSNKLKSKEYLYNKIMFRTELIKKEEGIFTTTMLNAYKDSLELYLRERNCSFEICNNIYKINCNNNENHFQLIQEKCNYKDFINYIKKSNEDELMMALLPYIAWLRCNEKYKSLDFNSILKLAQSHIVSYN